MGLFDYVHLSEGVELPKFSEDVSPHEVEWQSKKVAGWPSLRHFKIQDGRLLRKEVETEEMTDKEADEYARERSEYDSWEEWNRNGDELLEPLDPWREEVVEENWVDHNQHGSFEFHGTINGDRWSYEARFTKGELDKIILLSGPDD